MSRKKPKSGLLGFLISLIVVLAVVFVILNAAGAFLLSGVLEAAIGVPVHIDKFKLDLFSSRIGLYGLRIENPKGFKEPTLASIPEIFLHVDVPAIFQNRVHIHEIRLNLDEITVERNDSGAVNLTEIGAVKNAGKRSTPGSRGPSGPPQPAVSAPPLKEPARVVEPPVVQIDTVVLNLGRARYVDPAGERTFALEIRNTVLKNVTDPAQITQQIVFKTLQRAGLNALTGELQQMGLHWNAQAGSASAQLKQAWDDLRGKFKF